MSSSVVVRSTISLFITAAQVAFGGIPEAEPTCTTTNGQDGQEQSCFATSDQLQDQLTDDDAFSLLQTRTHQERNRAELDSSVTAETLASENIVSKAATKTGHRTDHEEATGQAAQAHDEASTQEKLMTRQRLTVADRMFSKADVDGDGLLSMSELNDMVSHFSSKYLHPILQEADWHSYDKNADGLLSQTELDGARKMISAAQASRTKAMLQAHLADKQDASSTSTKDGEHSLEQDAGKDDHHSLEQEFEASLIAKPKPTPPPIKCSYDGKTYDHLECIETTHGLRDGTLVGKSIKSTCCGPNYWRPSWKCAARAYGEPSEDCKHCSGC